MKTPGGIAQRNIGTSRVTAVAALTGGRTSTIYVTEGVHSVISDDRWPVTARENVVPENALPRTERRPHSW